MGGEVGCEGVEEGEEIEEDCLEGGEVVEEEWCEVEAEVKEVLEEEVWEEEE